MAETEAGATPQPERFKMRLVRYSTTEQPGKRIQRELQLAHTDSNGQPLDANVEQGAMTLLVNVRRKELAQNRLDGGLLVYVTIEVAPDDEQPSDDESAQETNAQGLAADASAQQLATNVARAQDTPLRATQPGVAGAGIVDASAQQNNSKK